MVVVRGVFGSTNKGQKKSPDVSAPSACPQTPIERYAFVVSNAMRAGEKYAFREGSLNSLMGDLRGWVGQNDLGANNIVTLDVLLKIAETPAYRQGLNFAMGQPFRGHFTADTRDAAGKHHNNIFAVLRVSSVSKTSEFGKR